MRYFLGFLAAIGLVILVFMLVMRGFSDDPKARTTPMTDYAGTDALVRMTVDGPIVADQQHQAYRITVGRSETRIETLQGYEYDPIETRTYENNQQSFTNFLRALDLAGFSRGVEKADRQAQDERGVCATGNRFVFEITNGTRELQRYWAASCSNSQGTFKGSRPQVKQLFDRQVPTPDFSRLVGRLRI